MYGGAHAAWCQSRGYAAIGPHPDAPPAETQRAPSLAPVEECPCGRARAGCTYHDPKQQPPRQLEFEFTEDWDHSGCGSASTVAIAGVILKREEVVAVRITRDRPAFLLGNDDAVDDTRGFLTCTVQDGTEAAQRLEAMFTVFTADDDSAPRFSVLAPGLRTNWAWFKGQTRHANGHIVYVIRFCFAQ